jgi:GxxExxY protein
MGIDSRLEPGAAEGTVENQLTDKIIGAAIEVHRHLGPGLLESAYEECLCYELSQLGMRFKRQVFLPIYYKSIRLESAYRVDLVVEDAVVVEIKATEETPAIYSAQVLTYLKAAGLRVGLLMNFNVPVLKRGLKRIVNHYDGPAPSNLDAETRRRGEEPNVTPAPRDPTDDRKGRSSNDSPSGFPPRLRVSASNIPASSAPAVK